MSMHNDDDNDEWSHCLRYRVNLSSHCIIEEHISTCFSMIVYCICLVGLYSVVVVVVPFLLFLRLLVDIFVDL